MRTRWSQNFLSDVNVARKIADLFLSKGHRIALEIGPGTGSLTCFLLSFVDRLFAVEIDPLLVAELHNTFSNHSNFSLVCQDFLQFDLGQFFQDHPSVGIISNLPYAVGSAIINKLFFHTGWDFGIFMVQKEVGMRALAKVGDPFYGIFSLVVQSRAHVYKKFIVHPSCFSPKPKILSMVIEVIPRYDFLCDVIKQDFFLVVNASFRYRRKTLLNSLKEFFKIDTSILKKIIVQIGLCEHIRAEQLPMEKFKILTYALQPYIIRNGTR